MIQDDVAKVLVSEEEIETQIDDLIENISEETDIPKVKITIYEQKQQTIRTVIEIEIAVPGTGGIVIIDIPVISCGGITAAAAAASSKQSSERTAAAQQRNDDQDDQRKSAHPPAVSLSGAGA